MCDFIFFFSLLCFMYTKQSQLQLLAAVSKQAHPGGSNQKNGTFIILKRETCFAPQAIC